MRIIKLLYVVPGKLDNVNLEKNVDLHMERINLDLHQKEAINSQVPGPPVNNNQDCDQEWSFHLIMSNLLFFILVFQPKSFSD